MGRIEGAYIPETEAEQQLLLGVHEVTREAYTEGVSVEDIGACLQFLGGAIVLHGEDGAHYDTPDSAAGVEETETTEACPECGTTIEEAVHMMGGESVIAPCGCTVDYDDLEGWER